jgi:hypothetical protein
MQDLIRILSADQANGSATNLGINTPEYGNEGEDVAGL